jgi:hypothetical protein
MSRQQSAHERVELPVESLLAIEAVVARFQKKDTAIQLLYDKWASGCQEYKNLIDASGGEPMLFRLPNHNGRLSREWPSRVLKDFPAPDHGRMCAIEYAQCCRLVSPMAHYIRHSHNLIEREYFRLVVPLEGGKLAYATRALTGPNAQAPREHG